MISIVLFKCFFWKYRVRGTLYFITPMLMSKVALKPGTPAPKSGQYQQVWQRGGSQGRPEVTAVAGKPLPPTPKPGERYVLVDPTRHAKK